VDNPAGTLRFNDSFKRNPALNANQGVHNSHPALP
jgi:hypothetical protein